MKIQKNDGPDFVGIGVQKSGTSWIGNILAQHPDVYIKKKKLVFLCKTSIAVMNGIIISLWTKVNAYQAKSQ